MSSEIAISPHFAGSDATLATLLARLSHSDIDQGLIERRQLDLLVDLASRLEENRFQLAVVGQFKRGKSSLLNALLETDVLPSGIVPLTAIPTFIMHAAVPCLCALGLDGRSTEMPTLSSAELKAQLAALVTETGNPHNVKGIERVDIGLPAQLLETGLVVIDTPGIGSLERHNTDVAVAALPHCDAALVVLSPDPLITDAEASYLGDIRRHAAAIIPVLNKADLLDAAEEREALTYLTAALHRVGIDAKVSVASSRTPDLAKAGVEALRHRIGRMVVRDRDRLLKDAIALKAKAAVVELAFQNGLALAALNAPVDTLDRAALALDHSASRLGQEARDICDLLDGERDRMLRALDEASMDLGSRIAKRLAGAIDDPDFANIERHQAFEALTSTMKHLLAEGYAALGDMAQGRLDVAEQRFADRVGNLLGQARAEASEALGVVATDVDTPIRFCREATLGWALRQSESMNPLPTGFWDAFLPQRWRAARVRAYLRLQADRLITNNIERMRWSLHQAISEAVRGYRSELTHSLDDSIQSVKGLVERSRAMRESVEDRTSLMVSMRRAWGNHLDDVTAALDGHVGDKTPVSADPDIGLETKARSTG